MQRAALEHQNALVSDTTGIVLQSLAEGVAKGVQDEQARVQKQRDEERQSKQAVENFRKFSSADSGTLIPKLTLKDNKFEFSASTPTSAESKSQYELSIEQGFVKDIQSGLDADLLRVKYPSKVDDIDKLQIAGTVKSRTSTAPSSSVEQIVQPSSGTVIPSEQSGFVSKGTDALGRSLGMVPISASDKKAAQEMKDNAEKNRLEGEVLVSGARDTLKTIKRVKERIGEFGLTGNIPKIWGTTAYDWQSNVDQLLSKKIVDLMAEMKRVSKTGATGFGQLNEKELAVLQNASTALKKGTSPERAAVYLKDMEDALNKIISGADNSQNVPYSGKTDFQNFDKMPMPEYDRATSRRNLESKYDFLRSK
jgi:hypothetical protein